MSKDRERPGAAAMCEDALHSANDKIPETPFTKGIHTSTHASPAAKDDQTAKKNVKDSVFGHLFQDKRYLLQLYRALHPEDTTATEESLDIITIKNVLMNGQYNDLGFQVGERLMILAESQSVWSVNIVVREMLYLAETYQGYLSNTGADLYRSRKVHLPKPELYVIFVGNRVHQPAELSLSREFFGGEECAIEVKVKVIYGSQSLDEKGNDDIIGQYIAFSKIYDKQRGLYGRTQEAIRETIRICVERDILRDYLQNCEKEVTSIMSYLFDEETIRRNHDRTIREECWEEFQEEFRKERLTTAWKMLMYEKMPVERIADYLNLTVEEIRRLEAELLQTV